MSPTTPPTTTGHTLRRARELAGLHERTAARALGVRRARLRELGVGRRGARRRRAGPGDRSVQRRPGRRSGPTARPLVTPDEPGVLVVGDERIDVSDAALGPTASRRSTTAWS